MLAAAALTTQFASEVAGVPRTPFVWMLVFPLLVIAWLALRGEYRPRFRLQILDDLRVIVAATAIAAMSVVTLRIVLDDNAWTAAESVRQWVFTAVYLGAGRAGLYWAQTRARRKGEAGRRALIVGAGNVGLLTAKRLLEEPEFGLHPIGFLDKEPLEHARYDLELPVLGASWDLERIIDEQQVEHVIVTFSTAPHHVILAMVRRCEERGIGVSIVPRLFEKMTDRITIDRLGGLPIVSLYGSDPKGWQFALKYAGDRIVAGLALLVVSPVLLFSALAILTTMGRPLLYRQRRVGRDGHEFDMLKFRTMDGTPESHGEADMVWAADQMGIEAAASDGAGANGAAQPQVEDRRTPAGRALRKLSLDELPQLWNVARGDMSMIGPRPERVAYVRQFEREIYRYDERHRVKSGITGWAQVHGLKGNTSLADRVEWDNYYIENWSLWLDVKILIMTIAAVWRFREGG
jgi:exopolysaccharide biosynthesis polyprenyl glycosylphosphotransferase